MTDAGHIDLSYGHFGELSYDVQKQVWLPSRNIESDIPAPGQARRFITADGLRRGPVISTLGAPRLVLPPQILPLPSYTDRTAASHRRTVEELVQAFPELAPSPALLHSSLAETTQHHAVVRDPTQSDILALGQAQNFSRSRKLANGVSVVAVVGGAARGLVRVFQLVPQIFGSKSQPELKINTEILYQRLQGIWPGPGSPIRQLQFAQENGKLTEWLAVRHGQGTSILRVLLRESEVPSTYNLCEISTTEPNVEFRFELQHIVTLPVRRSGGASHADVCFNPWDRWEFAVVDESSRWSTWSIKNVSMKANAWTLEARRSGRCTPSSLDATGLRSESKASWDGWGAVKWIRDAAGLLICGRKHIGAAELRDVPNYLPLPDFGLSTTADWISDVKQSPTDPQRVFILTSSRVLWAHLGQHDAANNDRSQLDARILLGWTHFRDNHDTSLSLQVVDLWPMTLVVLYSCQTDLKTAFTFEPGKGVSRIASSAWDPYILPRITCGSQPAPACATLLLGAVPRQKVEHGSDEQFTAASKDDGIVFLRCWTLTGALSLHECFLAHTFLTSALPLEASQSLSKVPMARSAYTVQDDFIVANGLLDGYLQDTLPARRVHSAGRSKSKVSDCRSERTINFESLAKDMCAASSVSLDESLQLVLDRIHEDPDTRAPGIISLDEFVDFEIAPGDIEEDSAALQDLPSRVKKRQTVRHLMPDQPGELDYLTGFTSEWLPSNLHPHPYGSLSRTYDALVESWIRSVASTISSRIRSNAGRRIRGVAAQLQLASHELRYRQRSNQQREQQTQPHSKELQATFTLPVREAPSTLSQLSQGSVNPAGETSVRQSSPMSEDSNLLSVVKLPTRAPTPSLQSEASPSSLAGSEDAAMQRLRTLTPVLCQPPLPTVLTDILDHWSTGQKPDDYDWDLSKTRLDNNTRQDDVEKAAHVRKRRRKEGAGVSQRDDRGESLSQLALRLASSQVDAPTFIQPSSQLTSITASQSQPGRFGGGKPVKKQKGRPGFR
ncbi:MAG: hypothetical protein L6R37_001477 [Teloschistes peruensis]|nr:MAG: hypothetical protein L6R37_001477 [Teloschistes peruensis]